MIFIDSNVFIYAVGRSHPLRSEAQNFFLEAGRMGKRLVTSADSIGSSMSGVRIIMVIFPA